MQLGIKIDKGQKGDGKQLDDDFGRNYGDLTYDHNCKTHIAQVDSVLLGGLIGWSVQDNGIVFVCLHGLGFVLVLKENHKHTAVSDPL